MNKINSIKINGVIRNIENIAYLTSLPTASAESPDFVSVNGVLYAKTLTNDIYVYITVQKKLTAGDNISISNTGVISVTGDLGTPIEANPELSGDETKLNSIAIDGVNYEIAGGAPITPVEVLPEETEENLNQYKIYEKDGTLSYLFNKALEEPVYNTLTVDAQISTSARTKMVAYKNKLYFTNGSSLYEFDPSTNTQTLLYTDSSYLISNAGIAAYNDLIYLFGAHTYSSSKVYHTYSRVLTYDLNTKTTTTRASLPDECIDMGCVVVGNCAYLFGGRYLWYAYSYNHTTCKSWILKYNLDSNTCSQLSGSYQSGWGQVALAHDTDIYVFGGVDDSEYGSGSSKAIYKFDTVNETMTKLSTTLPNAGYSLEGVNVQGQLYIYGGTSSTRIYKFNPLNNTITTLTATLGSSRNGCGSALLNDTAYIIGGGVTSISTLTFGSQIQYTTLPTLDVVNDLLDIQKQTINVQKQDKLTAGTGISISGSTINAYNTLTAGNGIVIDNNVIKTTIENYLRFDGYIPSSYEVVDLGTTYGFSLNSNGYYQSENKGVSSSFAICKVEFNLAVAQDIVIDCINYAETTCDYGLLSNLDTTLTSSSTADTSNVFKNFSGLQSSSVVSVTYPNVSAGEHFIYIKYRKDGSVNSNNDTLQFRIKDLISAPANTNIITDGTNTLDLSEMGHGVDIIDITDLDAIPEDYQDFEKLKTCYLKSGSLIYRLSYDGTSEDSGLYYENSDELYYNYLRITSNFNIEGNPDGVGNKQIATQDWVNTTKQDKLTAGRNIQITEDGIIGIANPNNCRVVSELPTPTVELANEETIYSYDGKLYNIVYNPEDPSDIHYQQLTYGDASFNPYFKDAGLVLDELADEDMSGGMWVYTPVRGE